MRGYNTFANRGRDFEDFVIQVNDLYTRSGKAVVYKVPTEFLPIRDSTGQIKSCKVEHKSCVDFLGRYNGTPVAVEAKQTHTGRIDFDAVQPHQAAFLDAWTPPPMASAAPEDFLPAWEVRLGGRTGLPYLETIEKLEGVLE